MFKKKKTYPEQSTLTNSESSHRVREVSLRALWPTSIALKAEKPIPLEIMIHPGPHKRKPGEGTPGLEYAKIKFSSSKSKRVFADLSNVHEMDEVIDGVIARIRRDLSIDKNMEAESPMAEHPAISEHGLEIPKNQTRSYLNHYQEALGNRHEC